MITKKFLALARLPMMWGQGIYAEQAIINYLKGRLPKLKQDEYGNLYYINPGTPLVCAHMDTVETEACSKKRHTVKMTA
jgi:putative aminopeptidase FrvX